MLAYFTMFVIVHLLVCFSSPIFPSSRDLILFVHLIVSFLHCSKVDGEEESLLSLSRDELGDSGRRMERVISVDLDSLLSPENFSHSIARIEGQFTGDLLALQDTLLELHVDSLSHMVSRLDYNSFYHHLRQHN